MEPKPIYRAHNLTPAYHLRYTWAGWPSSGTLPASPSGGLLDELLRLWETDGLRLLEQKWEPHSVLLTFSTTPEVSPVLLAARAKGRLQHTLRSAGTPCTFSRKVAVRSVGDNRISDVEQYILKQVPNASYADPRFREALKAFTVDDPSVDLSAPIQSRSGRYWYNLHVVLVVDGRHAVADQARLALIRDHSFQIAEKKGYELSTLSVLPDHWHAALRANIDHSPEEVALVFQNNLAYVLGQVRIWSYNYYAGTFGIYDMNAIRRNVRS